MGDEAEFVRVCEGKMKDNDGKLKFVDVNKKENEVEVKSIVTLHDVIEGLKEKFPGLVHMRIPICNSASPLEKDFDTLCNTLVGSSINTPIILNDQVGLSRATTASVAACMFKEFQISASFEGLVETVPGMDLSLLKMDRYKMDPNKDALFRGEFEVIKELVAELGADGEAQEGVRQGHRQERSCQDRRYWNQTAQGEHRRVQAELRDHGRRRPGVPQVQEHGQHPQVLLPHRLHRLHEAGC